MIGQYGSWAASLVGDSLPELSFRRGEFADVNAWRARARARVLERMACPAGVGAHDVRVLESADRDGLHVERLQWGLGYGPPTQAILVKPARAAGPLPGVLALHCHGGRKFWGRQKIADFGPPHPLIVEHRRQYYGGRAWANELARRGYVVLAPDAFAFASRMVLPSQCSPPVRRDVADPREDDAASIDAYHAWASDHENIMAKSLFSAGTTWPGVFFSEDRAALDVLASRDDVDAAHLGCGGLSGGGLRTCMLAGLDERIKAAVAVGFMTTWRDLLLAKVWTHTWMCYIPLLPRELDFPEILALRTPAPTMVLSTIQDQLFSIDEVRRSERQMREVFTKAGAADALDFRYFEGPHKFDLPMQEAAFAFFGRQLG